MLNKGIEFRGHAATLGTNGAPEQKEIQWAGPKCVRFDFCGAGTVSAMVTCGPLLPQS